MAYIFGADDRQYALVPMSVTSGTYSGPLANVLVPFDVSGGSGTLTLPAAPPDRTVMAGKIVKTAGSNALTIQTSGTDVLEVAGGSTSVSFSGLDSAVLLEYSLTAGIWYIVANYAPGGVSGTVPIGNGGTGQAAAPAQSATLVAASGTSFIPVVERLNVMAFGATGNGTTDDTTAIKAAMSAVTADGVAVYFPPGTYKISSTLTASVTGTQFVGSGWGSQILFDGTVAGTAIAASSGLRAFVRDLRISQTNATNSGIAIDASNFVNGVIERVLIDGGGASGVSPLKGINMNASGCYYNEIRACRVNYGGASSAGIYIGTGANSNTVQDVRLVPGGDDVNSSGIYITGASVNTLIHPDIESGNGNGIWLDTGAHSTTIVNAYTESNNINLKISSGVKAPTIIGGTYQNGTTANIQDGGAYGPIMLNAWPNMGNSSYNHVSLLNADEFLINSVPVPGNMWQPSDQNLIAWSFDPNMAANSTAISTGGVIHLVALELRYARTISNIIYQVATAGSGLTTGENFVGLIDSTGTLRGASADMTSSWNTTNGLYTTPLTTPYAAPAGWYYAAFVANGTTGPALTRGAGLNGSGATINAGLTAATYRHAVNSSGHTTLPSSITLSASTQESVGFFVAVS